MNRAPQACKACKKRKGKCDRLLPACTYCDRRDQHCIYSPGGSWFGIVAPQAATFPASFFLNNARFASSIRLPEAGFEIPSYVAIEIGDLTQRRGIAAAFFSTIHTWLPIVSKRRLLDGQLLPTTIHRADTALLILAMKLVSLMPSESYPAAQSTTYLATIEFFSSAYIRNCLTVATLQAAILLAVYEIGHAIYPAAFISVSTCANYAITMGLGWKLAPWLKSDLSWIEVEELRRVWWAVVILERVFGEFPYLSYQSKAQVSALIASSYACLGWPSHPIITTGPGPDDSLPCNDHAWDDGETAPNYAMTTQEADYVNMSPFALLAQATQLLDRVLALHRDTATEKTSTEKTSTVCENEITQLDKALNALLMFTVSESSRRGITLCCQSAICYSAMSLLHQLDLPKSLSIATRNTLNKIATAFLDFAGTILKSGNAIFGVVSPLTFHWGYAATCHFIQLAQEVPDIDNSSSVDTCWQAIQLLGIRWQSAEAYIKMLHIQRNLGRVTA